jgi:glycine/D-amino acid oxidase-like deaminating enzyme
MVVDYLIVGQGLCGTLLSRSLMKAGKSVIVIDDDKPFTATKVASGVINPVTGRRIVRTWKIEELLPYALKVYTEFGNELNEGIITQRNILDFFPSLQMREAFDKRLPSETEYLRGVDDEEKWTTFFNFHFGVGEIAPCFLVDLETMLKGWRNKLKEQNSLIEKAFSWSACRLTGSPSEAGGIIYKNITAGKIICCEGVAGFDNPQFKNLPYTRMKGEVIIASIPGLPRENIYKQGINIVPWKADLFWIGSTYEWDFTDILPTPAWRKKVEEHLKYWLKLPFEIVDHLASERPANLERRPFVGLHPKHPSVGVFNGMGAKGCALAPFFADQFTNYLIHQTPIYPEADVKRFEKVLGLTLKGI